jgi:hypothetical protein
MIEATWPPSSPTATQVVELAVAFGAHETAETLASGGDVAVVCQVALDTAEAAGSGDVASMTTPRAETTTIVNAATVNPRNVTTAASLQPRRAHQLTLEWYRSTPRSFAAVDGSLENGRC